MRRLFLFSAAALAMAGFAFVTNVRAQADQPANPPAGQPMDRSGDAVKDAVNRNAVPAKDANDIRKTLQTTTEAALTKGGLDDVVERFVDADRNRLGKEGVINKDQPTLDGRVAEFQKDWKAKYGQDFKMKDRDVIFNDQFVMIRQGEIPVDARTAGERQPGGTDAAGNKDSSHVAGGDTNTEPGRNVAVVIIPASHGQPEVMIPMIHEMPDSWKIDVPDNITAEQLRDNILNVLTKCDENKANWPADVNDAYRTVTHAVLVGIVNPNATTSNTDRDRMMPGDTTPPPAPR